MVARFISGKSIAEAIRYNEEKVKNKKAVFIAAIGYPLEKDQLTISQKAARLENLAALNERIKVNCVHTSLNFDPSEILKDEQLLQIADTYIRKIGFSGQPYLVYRHFDAAHPHIHIVTTNIQPDGKRIALHNIGRHQSEKARKEIEKMFELVQAESRKQPEEIYLNPVPAEKAVYGKSATKSAIANIVREVIRTWKFTSLAEYNTILKRYNVIAENGKEGSRMREKGGLMYSILDEHGKTIGVPIKASIIYTKPTLAKLQKVYEQNNEKRKSYRYRIKNCIDKAINEATDKTELQLVLEKEGIRAIFRENETGRLYGITFLDLKAKVVFKGSDLGKAYSASNLLKRMNPESKAALTEQKQDEIELLETLQKVDYSCGFVSVLSQLYARGIIIRQRENVDGEISFFLSNRKKTAAKPVPANAKMTAYLLANGYTKSLETQLQKRMITVPELLSTLSSLESWLSELLKSEAETVNYAANRRKKKKKRKPNW